VFGFEGVMVHNVRKRGQANRKSVFGSEDEGDSDVEVVENLPAAKVRKMDILLENLKRDQALREADHGVQEKKQDDKVPVSSTNLVIKFLAPELDENVILHEFGRFGPIASVKIMWPRDEEQRKRGWNTGFVAFMNVDDASKALREMGGAIFHNHRLSMTWGDPITLPEVPIWPHPGGLMANPEETRERAQDGPPSKEKVHGIGPDIIVNLPEDSRSRFVIDAMAVFVARDGFEFEQAIMENEKENKDFLFLFDYTSAEHIYYRWRVWSLSNGDSLSDWRVEPFLMYKDSSLWIPPPTSLFITHENSGRSELGERPLDAGGKDYLFQILGSLTSERRCISNAMIFIIENADSCVEISSSIIELITSKHTTTQKKLDLLHLISDVLYNTSAPIRNASQYRTTIQESLPEIFESLQEVYANASSRMMQETIRKHVLRVLRIWREWHMFHDEFLNSLQCQFIRKHCIDPSGNTKIDDVLIDEEYRSLLEGMDPETLMNECKANAVSVKWTREDQINKLLMVRSYKKSWK